MTIEPSVLVPWHQSWLLTPTRTVGEIGFQKNGTSLDIWLRVDGKPCWYGVEAAGLLAFLSSEELTMVTLAESDGNAE